MSKNFFEITNVKISKNANFKLWESILGHERELEMMLSRHKTGSWGLMSLHDILKNNNALCRDYPETVFSYQRANFGISTFAIETNLKTGETTIVTQEEHMSKTLKNQ